MPLRMAIIAASFPYKLQMDRFRESLRLSSYHAVLSEVSQKTDERTSGPLPNFRFLGVKVQRRAVDALGKPLAKNSEGWEPIRYRADLQTLRAAFRQAPRKRGCISRLEKITVDNRKVMPRLLLASNSVPEEPVETELDNVKKTLAKLEAASRGGRDRPRKRVASPVQFRRLQPLLPPMPGHFTNTNPMGMAVRPMNAALHGGHLSAFHQGRRKPLAADVSSAGPSASWCVWSMWTIKPGTIYQYRIQVRLANSESATSEPTWPVRSTPWVRSSTRTSGS